MSKTLFYWVAIGGCILLVFSTEPILRRLGIVLSDEVSEKVTGAVTALYFCLCAWFFFWGSL